MFCQRRTFKRRPARVSAVYFFSFLPTNTLKYKSNVNVFSGHSEFLAKDSRENSYLEESPEGSPGLHSEDGGATQSEAAETQSEK